MHVVTSKVSSLSFCGLNIIRACQHRQKLSSYLKSVVISQQTCYQQVDIRMRSHGLRQLVDDKSLQVVNRLAAS